MESNHWLFKKKTDFELAAEHEKYLQTIGARKMENCTLYTRVDPRARQKDFSKALSFEVGDPLWMLTRQWQFGRFKGKDCGSAVLTKIKVSRRRLDSIFLRRDENAMKAYSTDTPMEYEVEKTNRQVTPFVRIESALHFKKQLQRKLPGKPCDELLGQWMQRFPLSPFVPVVAKQDKTIETLKTEQNPNLKRLYAAYGKRIFDGYKLFTASEQDMAELSMLPSLAALLHEYKAWFRKKYLPQEGAEENCWNEQKMGHEVGMGENANVYEAEDYHSGRLSWYSFDGVGDFKEEGEKEEKLLSYFPVPADFPSAPSRRLWEFEDASVQLGHQTNEDFSLLSNAVVMQYVTMYGNDWMITPIEAETGTVLDVEGILVTDTFGERVFINASANQPDVLAPEATFTDVWNLFGTARLGAYESQQFRPQRGLLFPPTLRRSEESKAIEEVQFLRDEMANMLWGIETVINDGCDGTIEGKELSDAVLAVVEDSRDGTVNREEEEAYDYSFLVQNRAPLHWIPFIPQKTEGEMREMRFRRGRMPIFFNGSYNSVRPSTELLKVKEALKTAGGKTTKVVAPRFINEEEITGYGVKLMLTAQRTRWFLGKSFNWTGAKKVLSRYQANSGLMFDELIEKKSNKAIALQAARDT